MKQTILIIDDEEDILRYCRHALGNCYAFIHVRNGRDGMEQLACAEVSAVLLDRSFQKAEVSALLGRPDDARNEGLAILTAIRAAYPALPVIVVTQYGDYTIAKEALRRGATDFVEWGALTSDQYFLGHYLDRALVAASVGTEILRQKYNAFGIIGSSRPALELFSAIERFKDRSFPVLIEGASGTGKELVARALHFLSDRRSKPFVPVDCGALTDQLAESELFGHTKGSYTDAREDKPGLFEAAHEGTLFLDEVGNLSMTVQAKLLRALEAGEVRRIGETAYRKVNIRAVAATNAQLDASCFRQDLYWRLAGARIVLPTLLERREDIPELVHHFVAKYSLEYGRQAHRIAAEALEYLTSQTFDKNNVRELETLVKRCVVTASDVVGLADIVRAREESTISAGAQTDAQCSWISNGRNCPLMDEGTIDDLERTAILHRLRLYDGRKDEAARSLGIGRTKFFQKLKEYGDLS